MRRQWLPRIDGYDGLSEDKDHILVTVTGAVNGETVKHDLPLSEEKARELYEDLEQELEEE